MVKRSIGRALRLRIEPDEVSPSERIALLQAHPPVTDPLLMAFLAWRRAVLLLVAIALIPLSLLRFYDASKDDWPSSLKFVVVVPAAAEALLCIVCWFALASWTNWRKQRRTLFRAWLLFLAAPFAVFLVPMDEMVSDLAGGTPQTAFALKAAISMYALITLAPKVVSLLAGTIRAGIVTKMLFPGTAGPGWIVVLATPLYTLFVFTLLVVPYQLTGSGWFVGAMVALAIAQIVIGRAGYALTRPTDHADAVVVVGRARTAYVIAIALFALCLIVAMSQLVEQLGVSTILSTVLSFETNVLMLTLIGSDIVIVGLERARGHATGTAHHVAESGKRLEAFVAEISEAPAGGAPGSPAGTPPRS